MKSKTKKAARPKLYKIEKGIKLWNAGLPAPSAGPGAVSLTMQAMEKGDSFVVKDELEAMKARKVVLDRSKTDGRNYTTRKLGKGLRIWRVD